MTTGIQRHYTNRHNFALPFVVAVVTLIYVMLMGYDAKPISNKQFQC